MGAFQLGWQQGERHTEENRARQDEQRQAELANITNAGLSPEQQAEAIRTLYAKDPSALKRHVQNLFGRLEGKQPQPTPEAYPTQSPAGPAPEVGQPVAVGGYPAAATQAQRRAQILSGGQSAEQQYEGKLTAQQNVQLQGNKKLLEWWKSLSPEEQKIAGPMLGIQPRPVLKEYVSPDGKQRQWYDASQPDTIPEGWQATAGGGSGVTMKGTMVKSAQSPTGYAQTWVSKQDPSKIIAWQPITPSRWYTGFTSASTTTDPFGVTSSTARVTNPATTGSVDLSDATPLPQEEDQAAPEVQKGGTATPAATTPASKKAPAPRAQVQKTAEVAQTSGQKELDASGHIPAGAANPQLIQAANNLLDGMDVDKLPIPQKDRPAVMALAQQYGWGGQGTFTPKEKVLLKEAGTFIEEASKNKALAVLDNPISRTRLATLIGDVNKSGTWHNLFRVAASQGASKQEIEFLRMYNQLVGTISGLGQLTRSGRITEATIGRLMQELPNPVTTQSSDDAKARLQRLKNEIAVADQSVGKNAAPAPKSGVPSFEDIQKALKQGGQSAPTNP